MSWTREISQELADELRYKAASRVEYTRWAVSYTVYAQLPESPTGWVSFRVDDPATEYQEGGQGPIKAWAVTPDIRPVLTFKEWDGES